MKRWPFAWRSRSHQGLSDFKPGWPTTFGGVRALRNNIAQFHCPFAERMEKAGAILVGKTNSPVMGLRGVCDNYLFGATRNPSIPAGTQAALPVAAPQRWRTACFRLPREPMLAGRSAFLPHGAVSMATRRPTAACLS